MNFLSDEEKYEQLISFNQTKVDFTRGSTVLDLLKEQVVNCADSVALRGEEYSLTYQELDEVSNQLAYCLKSDYGIKSNDLVGMKLDKNEWAVICMLAILKAGGAYVLIDPEYPAARRAHILSDAKINVLVTSTDYLFDEEDFDGIVFALDVEFDKNNYPIDEINEVKAVSDLAYVIYTSGSTGNPKGVMIEHQSLANYLNWSVSAYGRGVPFNFGLYTSLSFDLTITSIYLPLISGGELRMFPSRTDVTETLERYVNSDLNCIKLTPAHLNLLPAIKIEKTALQLAIVGGDVLTDSHLEILKKINPEIRIFNEYGPTESTVGCIVKEVGLTEGDISIGKPIANTQVYLLNAKALLQPRGVTAEICIGGAGVARGYLNQDALTSEKFINNPFGEGRLYKTGDLARWLPNGELEFLGRADNQVKIRGHRIELGEIQNVLLKHSDISDAIIQAKEDKNGEKELVAYFIANQEQNVAALTTFLQNKLPVYMLPTHYVQLKEFPLTKNGKVDTKALPEVEGLGLSSGVEFVAPTTNKEKALAKVWMDVLNRENISLKDSFYNLGGDSIKSIQIVAKLKQEGYTVTVEQILRTPILEELSAEITENVRKIDQNVVSGQVEFTPIQKWLLTSPEVKIPSHFNQSVLLKSTERLDEEIIKKSLKDLIHHHDALRMIFKKVDQSWIQENRGVEGNHYSYDFYDLRHEEAPFEELDRLGESLQSTVSLSSGPLFRVALFRLNHEDRLALILHHLIVDGLSWRIILEDLSTLYQSYQVGVKHVLPLKTDSFQKWAFELKEFSNSEEIQRERTYWEAFTDNGGQKLPLDKVDSTNMITIDSMESFELDQVTTELLLTRVHNTYKTEINDILLTSLGVALKETFAVDQCIIKMEAHGREEILKGIDISRTVGWFTTMYPFLLDVANPSTLEEQLVNVKEALRKIPNKGIGYGMLKYVADNPLKEESNPEILFNYLGDFGNTKLVGETQLFDFASESIGANSSNENSGTELLDIAGMLVGGTLRMIVRYPNSRFEGITISKFVRSFKESLTSLINKLAQDKNSHLTPSDVTFKGLSLNEIAELNANNDLEDVYELSPLQEGIYYHWLAENASTLYLGHSSYRVKSQKLTIDNLKNAYQNLISRHGVLRTRFTNDYAGTSLQIVSKNVEGNFTFESISNRSDQELYLRQVKQNDREKGFDLETFSQMRLHVIELSDGEFEFIWSHHHIIVDGWCMSVLVNDFNSFLSAEMIGRKQDLAEVVPYSNYINWLSKVDKDGVQAYWDNYLINYDQVAEVPFKTKSKDSTYIESNVFVNLKEERLEKINSFCAETGITINTLIQAVWGYLLAQYNNTKDVVFGAVVSGRPADLEGVESMIGLFINTIPVRIRYSVNDTPNKLLKAVQQQSIESNEYHHMNLSEVQSRNELGANLLNHIMVFDNYMVHDLAKDGVVNTSSEKGLIIEAIEAYEENNYDLNIVILPSNNELLIDIRYNSNSYEGESMKRLKTHFDNLITAFVENSNSQLSELSYLSKSEEQELLIDFNATEVNYGKGQNCIDLFEEQVIKTPQKTALKGTDSSYTFEELNEITNQLADCFAKDYNVQPNDLVGVKLDKDEWAVISILAILKSGATYVPIDPDYPISRREYILEETQINLLVTNTNYLFDEEGFSGRVFAVDVEFEKEEYSTSRINNINSQETLAYIIYTSGSTGKPKGVMIEQHALVNYLIWARTTYLNDVDNCDFGLFSSLSFDLTVTSFYLPLISGGTLNLFDQSSDSSTILKKYFEGDARCIKLTPAHISLVKELGLESTKIQMAIVGGDKLQNTHIETLRKINPNIKIYNEYGPTESTVGCTIKEISTEVEEVLIGRPIANTKIYILNESNQLLPKGVVGEIYIAGYGLAKGYLNQVKLTADKFIQNPFEKGTKLYKTGDLGRWLDTGEIDFQGRQDEQLKIKGYRIELGEIETVLSTHNAVDDAAILVRESDTNEKDLVAYVVPNKKVAQTVHNVLLSAPLELEFDAELYEMENGVSIYAYNRSEVKMLYTEVFDLKTYYKNGISIPANATIVDIGANVGSFSIFSMLTFENPTIYSFEPLAPIFSLLEKNVSLYEGNVKVFNVGISDREEEAVFDFYPYATVLSGRHSENYQVKDAVRRFIDNTQETQTEEVSDDQMEELLENRLMNKKYTCQLKSLSQVITENSIDHIDLLKIDAENAEMDIINGIQKEDWAKIDQMVIEVYNVDDRLEKIKAILLENNFNVSVYQSEELEGTKFFDVYCIKEHVASTSTKSQNKIDPNFWYGTDSLMQSIQARMVDNLPNYMIPTDIVLLDKMPLTTNGKLDRNALVELENIKRVKKIDFVSPQSERQRVLAAVWSDVLKREEISIKDSFYNLGGDSIKSIQVVARLKQKGYTLKVEHILRTPILEDLALLMEETTQFVAQDEIIGTVALTPIQQWFFESEGIQSHHHFNQSVILKSANLIDHGLLEKCLIDLTRHHDALRMVYKQVEYGWDQYNQSSKQKSFTLDFCDLSESENALDQLKEKGTELQTGISLAEGPLFKVVHFRLKDGDRIGLIVHHLVVDGVSWRILLEDLSTLYTAYSTGKTPVLPLKTDAFQKWALTQKEYANSKELTQERHYWEDVCKSKIVELPKDKSGIVSTGINASDSFHLDKQTTERLQTEVHKVYGTEINDVLLTALGLAIKETFKVDKTVLKMEGHGREDIFDNIDINRTIGWFTTVYPFVLDVSKSTSEIVNLVHVKESLRKIPNKGIGYGTLKYLSDQGLTEELAPEVTFNYLGDFGSGVGNTEDALFEYGTEDLGPNVSTDNQNDAVLDVSGMLLKGELHLSVGYSTEQYRANTIEDLMASYQKNLKHLIDTLSEEQTVKLTPSDLTYSGLTVEELALLNADDNVEDVYELSPLQEGIYYHWLKDESSELYFEQIAYSIQSKGLKIEALREAYQQLIERHDVLRTHFTSEYGGRSLQVVKKKAPVNFSSEKITIESTDQLVQIRKNDREKGFDLNTGSQMRLSVLELSEGHYEFIWSFHHILMDGWCASILIYEMNALLRASHDHKSPSLHTPVPYSEYIKWLRKVDRKTSLNYWKATLEGYAELARIPSVKKEIASAYNHESGYISIHGELFNNSTKLCAQLGITQNTLIQGVWGYLLSRYNDTNDVVYGAVVSGRPSELNGVEEMIGLFINTIPVRVRYDETDTPMSLLQRMHEQSIEASTHHYVNLAEVQAQSELGADLINHIILFENYAVKEIKEELIGAGESSINVNHINVFEQTNFDFNLIVKPLETSFDVNVAYNANAIEKEVIARLLNHFVILLQNFTKQGSQPLKSIELLAEDEKRHLLHDFNDTKTVFQDNKTLTQLFEEQVAQSPDEVALVYEDVELTFSELDKKANQLGHYLKETYAVRPDELIGIQLERSEWMLIAILGVLKSGGAYVPIATDMPQTRVDRILEDSNVLTLLDEVALDVFRKVQNDYSSERVRVDTDSSNLAYVIYTSGSTGMPKGVMIEHKNVANFFRGMTDIFGEEKGTFLSMTNFTFDISVLELLWTLTRGYKVVIQGDALRVEDSKVTRPLDFSLFYFGNSNHKANNYQLLMEGAKYADENGYHAVWTPERHFNEFGGLYPNSAITGSALAAVTKNIGIRAGSVVFPLHHPIRIAEDWSVIDNLSGGRAGIACASGWHLNDFVLAPHNYENRHQVMYDSIAIIKKLWRGEKVSFENGNGNQKAIEIFPRPIQQELPIWITSAGSLETFISAGKIGANILTHLLGESVEGLTEKIKAYRRAYSESGFDVMNAKVTLMLHTYIDDEENLDKIARKPFIEYLKSSAGLLKNLVSDIDQNAELDRFSEDEMEAIYERAYRRFVAEASMVGTEETCLKMMKQLSAIGVDEIAALIDFGVEFNAAMDSLKRLTKIKKKYAAQNQGYSVFEQIKKHEITHLQITPSMGTLLNQYLSKDANWNSLKYLLLGGERATIQLVNEIHEKLPGVSVYNMYGPTETTIWSTVKAINRGDTEVEIGNPIANTEIFILDKSKRLVPIGIQGEIYIGGKGVARGYTDIQKTEENFIENPFADGEKIYRTGDYGYWLENGSIYYVGRKDEQVKLRGYRIELGEIEHALCEHPSIESAVVKIVGKDNQQLVAYIVSEKLDDVDELRIFLRSRLPHYMIPNHFQKLDKLPLNNNGKIDRKSLPDLSEFSGKVEYVEPRNETEKILAEIWKRLLKTEKVSILDDFFAQGGHSLTATQVIIRIDEIFGVKIDLRNFLEHPTIESLAIDIETLQWAQASKEELNVEGDELII